MTKDETNEIVVDIIAGYLRQVWWFGKSGHNVEVEYTAREAMESIMFIINEDAEMTNRRNLTSVQRQIMMWIDQGWNVLPGDGIHIQIDGTFVCDDTMKELERLGLVEQVKPNVWGSAVTQPPSQPPVPTE